MISGFLINCKLERHTTEVLRIIDKMDKLSGSQINDELKKTGLSSNSIKKILSLVSIQGTAKEVIKKLSDLSIDQISFTEALINLSELGNLLKAGGMKTSEYIFDLKIARGFDYYTGIVFEMFIPGNRSSIGSGGRYDNLVSYYRKEALTGVGASIGVSRLFNIIKEKNTGPASLAQALIVVFSEELLPYCFEVATLLRQNNINIEIYPEATKMAKQLNYANKLSIPLVLLCGENEERKKQVTIKNMKTGKQVTVSLSSAVKKIRSLI